MYHSCECCAVQSNVLSRYPLGRSGAIIFVKGHPAPVVVWETRVRCPPVPHHLSAVCSTIYAYYNYFCGIIILTTVRLLYVVSYDIVEPCSTWWYFERSFFRQRCSQLWIACYTVISLLVRSVAAWLSRWWDTPMSGQVSNAENQVIRKYPVCVCVSQRVHVSNLAVVLLLL